jgi:SNF2 family DNA or RNA helicase
MNLFPYQEEGVDFLLNRPMPSKSALLADEMGLDEMGLKDKMGLCLE